MKKLILLVVIFLASCSGIIPVAPTATPTLNPMFIKNAECVVEEGTKINSMTKIGVTYLDYKAQLNEFLGCADLFFAVWPESLDMTINIDIDNARTGWVLAFNLWGLKINDKMEPTAPSLGDYQEYVDYAGDNLIYGMWTTDSYYRKYQGKKYISYENIGVLFSIAGEYFESGRVELLELISSS